MENAKLAARAPCPMDSPSHPEARRSSASVDVRLACAYIFIAAAAREDWPGKNGPSVPDCYYCRELTADARPRGCLKSEVRTAGVDRRDGRGRKRIYGIPHRGKEARKKKKAAGERSMHRLITEARARRYTYVGRSAVHLDSGPRRTIARELMDT